MTLFTYRIIEPCILLLCLYLLIDYYTQAARETGALQAAKNKLEKQVEELTWRLQLEKRMRVSYIFNGIFLTPSGNWKANLF